MVKKNVFWWVVAAVIILFVAMYFIGFRNTNKNYDSFAKCLTEKGAVMYGTYWCSYCNAQKGDFGKSAKFINYVECTEDPDACTGKGVESFPTWIINDVTYRGKQPLSRLAALTGCELVEG